MKPILEKIAVALLFFVFIWWFTGPSRDETVTYSASCANGIVILPSLYVLDLNNFEKTYDQYQKMRSECRILAGNDTTYRINFARAEIYYEMFGIPKRLVDCAIIDNKNWRCAYPDGSGYITVVNGLTGIAENDYRRHFSLHRYQYWYVTIYSLIFSENPKGKWLVPEQQELYPD